jgi:DNA replication and repair protein RecF
VTTYKLSLQNFRCFERLALEFESGITWLEGDNASGKTSVLEAIYLITRARSFRTATRHEVIRKDHDHSIARLQFDGNKSVAAKLTKSNVLFRANQQNIQRTSELSKQISVQFIGPHAHTLITGEPSLRRAFIDWGLFHVEPIYLGCWKHYLKALRQRNAALQNRSNDRVLDALDKQLVVSGLDLTRQRQQYVTALAIQFDSTLSCLTEINDTSVYYRKGWSKDSDYAEALANSRSLDRKRAFTSVGPHRADLQIAIGQSLAKKYGSNGQQKLIAVALIIAQQTFVDNGHKLLLIDDLLSELDVRHSSALLRYLDKEQLSAIITSTSLPRALAQLVNKRFHVEHRTIKSVVE